MNIDHKLVFCVISCSKVVLGIFSMLSGGKWLLLLMLILHELWIITSLMVSILWLIRLVSTNHKISPTIGY